MTLFIDRIDAVPVQDEDFSYAFLQWITNLVTTLNSDIQLLQNSLNLLTAQSYTATQINTLFTDGALTNGVLLYDTTNNVYVGMQSGALVQFTTASYP